MIFDFFSGRTIKFKPSGLEECLGPIRNPGRGWYQIFHFPLPGKWNFQELRWSLRKDEMLAMVIINIGNYWNSALDQDALESVESILDFFKQEKKDVILRFVYDSEGKGLVHEPTLFSQVEEHIRQLSPIICAYTKTIYILQGLFVGSWGEMHGSKFLSSVHLNRLNELVEAAAGEYTWLAVRKPSQWRVLHLPDEASVRMGLFDDGIFGSETDLGTFGYLKRAESQWEESWCPRDELAFENLLCKKVPHGGEVVSAQQVSTQNATNVIQGLRRMHISYLNSVHDAKILQSWKQQSSPWSGISLYDYVGAHLGYRFCVRKVKVIQKQGQLRMEIVMENTGFAPCYEEYCLTLDIVTADGALLQQETNWDLRELMPEENVVWTCSLPKITGEVFLSAKRKKDGRPLSFAYAGGRKGKLFLGKLNIKR